MHGPEEYGELAGMLLKNIFEEEIVKASALGLYHLVLIC